MSYPPFGAAGSVESEVVSRKLDQLEFRNGFDTTIFGLKYSDTVKRSKPSSCALTYGIEADGGSIGQALESVSMTEDEEHTPPHVLATAPGAIPSPGGEKLTYTDGMIFMRKKVTVRISGFGAIPTGFERGRVAAGINISPAVGASPVINPTIDLIVTSAEETKASTDWVKFSLELVGYTPGVAGGGHLITPTLGGEPMSEFYKVSRTTTLSYNGPANVEESIEYYE